MAANPYPWDEAQREIEIATEHAHKAQATNSIAFNDIAIAIQWLLATEFAQSSKRGPEGDR